MSEQNNLNLDESTTVDDVEKYKFEPIKGYPMLHWHGKRPFTSTQYYPAQKKEVYGEEVNGWINKIFWGDNLQVMSHLLKEYRGKVDLIYIDPPFDSKADYKKRITLRGNSLFGDHGSFEEKQYTDIWNNDEFLQYIYERIILCREILSEQGSILVHCDQHKNHYIRCILDEVFGIGLENDKPGFRSEVIWCYGGGGAPKTNYPTKHDTILWYSKSSKWAFNKQFRPYSEGTISRGLTAVKGDEYELSDQGAMLNSWWSEKEVQKILSPTAYENLKYPTQKPEGLISRLIKGHSNEGDLVFDCFMGSGTTQACALKNNRRFIGADINLGAIQTTTKRLLSIIYDKSIENVSGFEVCNVNNYDIFRNPVEAKQLLLEALEIQPLSGTIYDGDKDGYMVKIMPVNRISTREDLNELIANFPYKTFEKRKEEYPNKPVESLMLICMGHEPDLKAHLEQECGYKLNIQVVDILRDKSHIEFKRDSEANIELKNSKLTIIDFFPMNLMQKLSLQKESVSEWKELVETVVIDWNYDGAVMEPSVVDVPERKGFVQGEYEIPADAGTIKIKITDLLSESYEEVIKHG